MRGIISSLSPSRSSSEVPPPSSPEPAPASSAARQPSGSAGSLPRVSSQTKLPTAGHSRSNSMSTISSSDDLQALRQEVTRLSDENASLSARLEIAPKSNNEVRELCRKLQADNRRLTEAMERRNAMGKQPVGSDELWRLREENRVLREEKAKLQAEMDKVTKVATLVGSRLARLVMDARRSSTGNTQLVDELKRYNRRLEIENDRLYNIIQITQGAKGMGMSVDNRSLTLDSGGGEEIAERRGSMNGLSPAELMRKLESSQSRLQEDMSKLSRDAANLQSLSVARSDSSGVVPPRTPSIFEDESCGNEDLRMQNARFADEIERLREDLAVAHSAAEQLDNAHAADKAQLKRQMDEMTAAAAQMDTERRELQEAVDELEAQGLQLQRELHAAREFQDTAAQLEDENAKLCRDLDKAMEDHASVIDQLAAAESSCSAAQHRLQQLEETLQQALLVNEQRTMASQEQAAQIQRLEKRCQKHERTAAGLRTERDDLTQRSSNLATLTSEHAALQAKLAEVGEARQQLEQSSAAQAAEMGAQIAELQQERDDIAASSADAVARLQKYAAALQREKYELLDNKAVEEADMAARVASLKHEVQTMTEEKACQTAEVSAQATAWQRQRDEYASNMALQTAEMSAKITALHAEKDELVKARQQRERETTARIAALEKERDDMASKQAAELVDMSGKVAALQSQVSSWEELKSSHSTLGQQMAKLQREKAALIGDQERTRLGFEAATVELAESHATQLHKAEQERKALRGELTSLRSHASSLEDHSSELERRVTSLSEERGQLLERSTSELHSLRSSHSQLEEEMGRMRLQLSQEEVRSTAAASELERRTSSFMLQHKDLQSHSSVLLSEKQQLEIDAAANLHRLEEAAEANAELEAEVEKLRRHVADLERRSFAMQGELQVQTARLTREKEDLEEQAAADTQRLTAASAQLTRELADMRSQALVHEADSSSRAAALEGRISALTAQNDELQVQSAAQIDRLQSHTAQLQQQLDALRDSALDNEARASTSKDQLQAEAAALAAELQELKAKHGAQVSQLEAALSQLRAQHEQLQLQLATRTSMFEADKLQLAHRLEDVEQGFQTELSEVHNSRAQLTQQYSSLQEQLQKQEALRIQAEQALASLTAEHGERETRITELESLHKDCGSTIEHLQQQLAGHESLGREQQECLEQLREDTATQVSELESLLAQEGAERLTKEQVLASLMAAHEGRGVRIGELETQMTQQAAANSSREAQLKALATQHNERCNQIAQLEDKIAQQRERFDRLQTHHDAVVGQLQEELEGLAKKHAELEASSREELKQSKSDSAALSAQMLTLRRQRSEIQMQTSSAAADLATSRANEMELAEQLQAAQHAQEQHAEEAARILQQLQAMEHSHSQLQVNHDELQQERGQLSSAHDALQQKYLAYSDTQQARNEKLAQVMQDLEEQQAQLSKDKEDLARQLALLQASAAHEREAAAQRDADNAAHAEEFAASSALLASLVRTAQVQRPEELAGKLTELQLGVARLSSEAAEAGELREGHQTLLSANQRLSRRLAELQKTPGKTDYSPAGSTATNTPAEYTPPLSRRSSSEDEFSGHKGELNGEVAAQLRNSATAGPQLHSPFSLFSGTVTPPPTQKLPTRATSPAFSSTSYTSFQDGPRPQLASAELANGAKGKLKFWRRRPSKREPSELASHASDLGLTVPVNEPTTTYGNAAFESSTEPAAPPDSALHIATAIDYSPDGLEGDPDLEEGTNILNKLAWEHVQAAYDQYVDHDDVDGFMTKLGFTGFCPPTLAHDLDAAFDAALGVVEGEAIPADADEWDKAMAASARALLETWRGLALGA